MRKEQIISILENAIIPADCPGWPPSIELARVNLISALKAGKRAIDYPDHLLYVF